ncbi:MAG: TonB-dependent receptor [candidate division Zixibacteria bacterium]|nr:TonB-dependent receptor [candidate division Zixibacteria bacterium]
MGRIGYGPDTLQVDVRSGSTEVTAILKEATVELAEVVVVSTRTERRIADEPTRVEVTDRDDVEEQIAASPGNVAELLTEAGGVRVQRTSAGLGSASIRIRGLRGRYTKFLSDGLPLFGVSTEGLTPLQIPPVDLQRVEVIKGVASALYGPTALGGVVNLVSQRSGTQREILLNQTSRGGTDASLWDARRLNTRWGYTLLASGDFQGKRDVDGDGWADIPAQRRGVLRPRLFWADSLGNSWFLTSGVTGEDREGGTVLGGRLLNGQPFREDLRTRRADAGSVARLVLGSGATLALRGSATEEWRTHWFGSARERDRRNTLFGEAALTLTRGTQALVAGAAIERDAYHALDVTRMDYDYATPGLFAEHLWSPTAWFSVSSSARLDFHSAYGDYLSPRVSALFHSERTWSVRASAGTGVFAPTPFTEETEVIGLSHLRPITNLTVERAQGASLDMSRILGPVEVDAAAFATTIRNPVALRGAMDSTGEVELVNARQPTRGDGVELFASYKLEPFSIITSYTYLFETELDIERGVRREAPLNPRHAGGLTAVWEAGDDTRIGIEAYYTGRQTVADDPYRSLTQPYLFVDLLIQQRLGRVRVFLHGENLNNVHQSHFDPLLRTSPGLGGRWTTDVWAPLEGRVVNFGIRWMY